MPEHKKQSEFEERVIHIDRVSRTVKGGRRISFRALLVLGDRKGKVGFGVGKGKEVAEAINKAKSKAKKKMIKITIKNDSIAYPIRAKYNSANLILKPAPAGTSVIAGGAVRAVIEVAGIKNIVAKIFGSNNKINNVKATFLALRKLKATENLLRTRFKTQLGEKQERL
ncbi:MAG: small subunit ribosomal protein S5 [Candidatus Berkelbacteria bacterium Licking1014_7]|uniref:Small ribosomal subunit protein uS5 n=1 Tax=Candidatus Berkelbacteria bacterium Licking1014_7 TaxID=2017147 RepID=A0A554LKI7_9BACT|nr:MAG: small subunit ribosomal protein S5 [Candidatus Berkelbacteria bacterium Licking1014_7]